MTDDDVLFECDFSVDELAVLADLLEIPALPGVDPDMEVAHEAKGAAARGLLARGVVVADAAKGTVEITQPYATMLSTVLLASTVMTSDAGVLTYLDEHRAVEIGRPATTLVRWRVLHQPHLEPGVASAHSDRGHVVVQAPA